MGVMQRDCFTLPYVPQKDAVVSNRLSHTYLNNCKTEIFTEDMEANVHLINKSQPVTYKKLNPYCKEIITDELEKSIVKYMEGSKSKRKRKRKKKPSVKQFGNIREDTSMLNGILLKGNRILVPTDLRREDWNLIHS